jgi:O-antigen ligase
MKPFYNDHTAYGVAIALFVPVAFFLAMEKQKNPFFKTLTIAALVVLIIGLGFSYSRAAWISVVGAIAVYYAIKMGMKIKWMLVIAAVGVAFFFTYQADVLYKLGKNNQDSSYNLADQVKSISNISTDASNVERLNRWASALRMFEERPITGWGPGTYQFIYGKYQRSYQLSTISTNSGNLGNAHSEYIGPLADQGVLGTLFTVLVFGLTFATGIKVYRTARNKRISTLAIAFTLGLFTYYVHGIFNNFLDTDKLSVPFWGFTAAIVALDVYFPKKEESF